MHWSIMTFTIHCPIDGESEVDGISDGLSLIVVPDTDGLSEGSSVGIIVGEFGILNITKKFQSKAGC